MLQSLEFRVNTPTCYTFLSLLIQHLGLAPATAALSIYLLVRPFTLSHACLFLGRAHVLQILQSAQCMPVVAMQACTTIMGTCRSCNRALTHEI